MFRTVHYSSYEIQSVAFVLLQHDLTLAAYSEGAPQGLSLLTAP